MFLCLLYVVLNSLVSRPQTYIYNIYCLIVLVCVGSRCAFFCQECEDQSALPHSQQARPDASELGVLVHQNHPGAAEFLVVFGGLPSGKLLQLDQLAMENRPLSAMI